MGKPRMIIVIRHAQSEGNQNRQIHQTVPDHRVKLTEEGWKQAHDAGRQLRSMLRPDDTLQIYTSPYRRTRETTEGLLQTLTSNDKIPSPFSRQSIKVWEEPRLREQDFGNFQPDSAAMEKMWQERADYGHFFYRIPNGESAADAYDRISGFNESLWRSFNEPDFPSICILVTHGLMTRVFLMKWYHWSIEYFEDLRNVDHCEFVVMQRNRDGGKYILQNELRTWSELKRERAAAEAPEIPTRTQWGTVPSSPEDFSSVLHGDKGKENAAPENKVKREEEESEAFPVPLGNWEPLPSAPQHPQSNSAASTTGADASTSKGLETSSQNDVENDNTAAMSSAWLRKANMRLTGTQFPNFLEAGRDFGGSSSGAPTPSRLDAEPGSNADKASLQRSDTYAVATKLRPASGIFAGAFADALGDQQHQRHQQHQQHQQQQQQQSEKSNVGMGMNESRSGSGSGSASGYATCGSATPAQEDLERAEEQDRSLRGSVY